MHGDSYLDRPILELMIYKYWNLTLHGKCRLDEHINLLLKLNYAIQADKLRIAKPSIQVSLNLFNFLHSNDINV